MTTFDVFIPSTNTSHFTWYVPTSIKDSPVWDSSVSQIASVVNFASSRLETITFNPPVNDPVLYLGQLGTAVLGMAGGPWTFSAPFEILGTRIESAAPDSRTVVDTAEPNNKSGLTSVLLRFPGTHSSITISDPGDSDGELMTWGKYVTSTPVNVAC